MARIVLNDILMEQAKNNADDFGMCLGEMLIHYWIISFQYLYELDPDAAHKINIALIALSQDKINIEDFYKETDRPVREIGEIVDINAGFIRPH